jgi:transcriptional regulator with XRE-family HTH domain
MQVTWRLHVKLKSRRLLADYVKHMGWTGRRLAREAGLGHAIVAHLLNGTRNTCSPATAKAIEEALGCPRNLLFEPSVSSVSASKVAVA